MHWRPAKCWLVACFVFLGHHWISAVPIGGFFRKDSIDSYHLEKGRISDTSEDRNNHNQHFDVDICLEHGNGTQQFVAPHVNRNGCQHNRHTTVLKRDISDCAKYSVCLPKKHEPMLCECAQGYKFSQESRSCLPSASVQDCPYVFSTELAHGHHCDPVSSFGSTTTFVANPVDCTQYSQCIQLVSGDSILIEYQCPGNQGFDLLTNQCRDNFCGLPALRSFVTRRRADPFQEQFVVPVTVQRRVTVQQKLISRSKFNPEEPDVGDEAGSGGSLKLVNSDAQYWASSLPRPRVVYYSNSDDEPSQSQDTLSPLCLRSEVELNEKCSHQGFFPIDGDCAKYMICAPGANKGLEAFVLSCPDDTLFSRLYRRCVPPRLNDCGLRHESPRYNLTEDGSIAEEILERYFTHYGFTRDRLAKILKNSKYPLPSAENEDDAYLGRESPRMVSHESNHDDDDEHLSEKESEVTPQIEDEMEDEQHPVEDDGIHDDSIYDSPVEFSTSEISPGVFEVAVENEGDRDEELEVAVENEGDGDEELEVAVENEGDRDEEFEVAVENEGDRDEEFEVAVENEGDRDEEFEVAVENEGDRDEEDLSEGLEDLPDDVELVPESELHPEDPDQIDIHRTEGEPYFYTEEDVGEEREEPEFVEITFVDDSDDTEFPFPRNESYEKIEIEHFDGKEDEGEVTNESEVSPALEQNIHEFPEPDFVPGIEEIEIVDFPHTATMAEEDEITTEITEHVELPKEESVFTPDLDEVNLTELTHTHNQEISEGTDFNAKSELSPEATNQFFNPDAQDEPDVISEIEQEAEEAQLHENPSELVPEDELVAADILPEDSERFGYNEGDDLEPAPWNLDETPQMAELFPDDDVTGEEFFETDPAFEIETLEFEDLSNDPDVSQDDVAEEPAVDDQIHPESDIPPEDFDESDILSLTDKNFGVEDEELELSEIRHADDDESVAVFPVHPEVSVEDIEASDDIKDPLPSSGHEYQDSTDDIELVEDSEPAEFGSNGDGAVLADFAPSPNESEEVYYTDSTTAAEPENGEVEIEETFETANEGAITLESDALQFEEEFDHEITDGHFETEADFSVSDANKVEPNAETNQYPLTGQDVNPEEEFEKEVLGENDNEAVTDEEETKEDTEIGIDGFTGEDVVPETDRVDIEETLQFGEQPADDVEFVENVFSDEKDRHADHNVAAEAEYEELSKVPYIPEFEDVAYIPAHSELPVENLEETAAPLAIAGLADLAGEFEPADFEQNGDEDDDTSSDFPVPALQDMEGRYVEPETDQHPDFRTDSGPENAEEEIQEIGEATDEEVLGPEFETTEFEESIQDQEDFDTDTDFSLPESDAVNNPDAETSEYPSTDPDVSSEEEYETVVHEGESPSGDEKQNEYTETLPGVDTLTGEAEASEIEELIQFEGHTTEGIELGENKSETPSSSEEGLELHQDSNDDFEIPPEPYRSEAASEAEDIEVESIYEAEPGLRFYDEDAEAEHVEFQPPENHYIPESEDDTHFSDEPEFPAEDTDTLEIPNGRLPNEEIEMQGSLGDKVGLEDFEPVDVELNPHDDNTPDFAVEADELKSGNLQPETDQNPVVSGDPEPKNVEVVETTNVVSIAPVSEAPEFQDPIQDQEITENHFETEAEFSLPGSDRIDDLDVEPSQYPSTHYDVSPEEEYEHVLPETEKDDSESVSDDKEPNQPVTGIHVAPEADEELEIHETIQFDEQSPTAVQFEEGGISETDAFSEEVVELHRDANGHIVPPDPQVHVEISEVEESGVERHDVRPEDVEEIYLSAVENERYFNEEDVAAEQEELELSEIPYIPESDDDTQFPSQQDTEDNETLEGPEIQDSVQLAEESEPTVFGPYGDGAVIPLPDESEGEYVEVEPESVKHSAFSDAEPKNVKVEVEEIIEATNEDGIAPESEAVELTDPSEQHIIEEDFETEEDFSLPESELHEIENSDDAENSQEPFSELDVIPDEDYKQEATVWPHRNQGVSVSGDEGGPREHEEKLPDIDTIPFEEQSPGDVEILEDALPETDANFEDGLEVHENPDGDTEILLGGVVYPADPDGAEDWEAHDSGNPSVDGTDPDHVGEFEVLQETQGDLEDEKQEVHSRPTNIYESRPISYKPDNISPGFYQHSTPAG